MAFLRFENLPAAVSMVVVAVAFAFVTALVKTVVKE